MQYRAIGMLKGKYIASEEQFNRGNIAVDDGTLVDAVLLGRVTSLIKKHIDLETDHVWVVYPRTLYSDDNVPALHVQIVGVWEPETLNDRNKTDAESAEDSDDDPRYLTTAEATEQCDHFSIRGEIAKYDEEKEEITVNIVQKSKSENTKPKRPFKLLISGTLTGRTVGYFWDLEVEREEGKLILQTSKPIAVVPPKRKSKTARRDTPHRRGAGKPRSGSAPKPVPKPKVADKTAKDAAIKTDTAASNSSEENVIANGAAIAATSAQTITAEQPSQVEPSLAASAATLDKTAAADTAQKHAAQESMTQEGATKEEAAQESTASETI